MNTNELSVAEVEAAGFEVISLTLQQVKKLPDAKERRIAELVAK